MPYKLNIKIFFWFVLFFTVTFLEAYNIAGLSVASIWKIPFILYCTFYTISNISSVKKEIGFVNVYLLFCLLFLFHSNMINSITPEFIDVTKLIAFVSIFYYVIRRLNKIKIVVKFLFWASVMLILTNIPYLLGIIKAKVQKDYTISYGESMEANAGFSGPYLTIHSQAIFMAGALLFIIFLLKNFPKQFKIHNPLIIISLTVGLYCLYLSFARTGWIFFTVGLVFIFIQKINYRNLKRSLPFVFSGILFFAFLFLKNESFRRKLLDEREYSTGSRINDVGSGRLLMGKTALENWWESDLFSLIKGYGFQKGQEKMEEKLGARLFSHNGFIDILQRSGIVGLICFLIILVKLNRYINHTRNIFTPLARAFFWGWICVGLFQEFTIVYLNIYLALILALTYLADKSNNLVNVSKM